mgnify:FL=1
MALKRAYKWLFVVILFLVGLGVVCLVVIIRKNGNEELASAEQLADSANRNQPYLVEITQQFVDSVSNYNRIYPYSEGFAIVRKGKYYGFVEKMIV